jgi:hypothetical protein
MDHDQQPLLTFVEEAWVPAEDMAPKLHRAPTVVAREVKLEDPNETRVEQLFVATELLLVTPQSCLGGVALFFNGRFIGSAFCCLYLVMSISKVHYLFTNFPLFFSLFFQVPTQADMYVRRTRKPEPLELMELAKSALADWARTGMADSWSQPRRPL